MTEETKIIDAEFTEGEGVPIPEVLQPQATDVKAKEIPPGDNFYDALEGVADGGKMTKQEWGDPGTYGFIENSRLKLHKSDGKTYDWILSDGDIAGMDWYII